MVLMPVIPYTYGDETLALMFSQQTDLISLSFLSVCVSYCPSAPDLHLNIAFYLYLISYSFCFICPFLRFSSSIHITTL